MYVIVYIILLPLLTGASYTDALSPWLVLNRSEARDSAPDEHILDLVESYLDVAMAKPFSHIGTPMELAERARWLEEADKLLHSVTVDKLSQRQKERWWMLNLRIQSMTDMFEARFHELLPWDDNKRSELRQRSA